MIRKEIRSASGVVLVFKIEGDEVEVHWPGDAALFSANDFIELGQTLSSIEQGEARDAEKLLDMPRMAEGMLNSMNRAMGEMSKAHSNLDKYNFQLRELGNEIQRAFEGEDGGQNE
jgi:hypothetical protein